MTKYLAIVLCLLALSGSRAAGVRTTTTTTKTTTQAQAQAPAQTLYGSAAPAQAQVQAPAQDQAASSQDANANAPQTSTPTTVFPPSQLQIFAVDIHFVAGYDLSHSYIAYHYCGGAPGVTQCAIYDGVGPMAKLIAVEIIVPESVFENFSDSEKRLWHSHAFAIQSGTFVLPEVSAEQELSVLAGLSGTYGKVTDFYQPGNAEPTGSVQTAFGITSQEQLDQVLGLARQIDQGLNLTTTYEQRAAARKNFTIPAAVEGQDPYHQTGLIVQYNIDLYRVNKVTGAPN